MKRAHWLCEDCLAKGIYKPATIVHHIEELTPFNIHRPEIATGFDNLRAVCRECHMEHHPNKGQFAIVNEQRKKEKQESLRYSVDENGKVTAR